MPVNPATTNTSTKMAEFKTKERIKRRAKKNRKNKINPDIPSLKRGIRNAA
jgi:hypothetical protein